MLHSAAVYSCVTAMHGAIDCVTQCTVLYCCVTQLLGAIPLLHSAGTIAVLQRAVAIAVHYTVQVI